MKKSFSIVILFFLFNFSVNANDLKISNIRWPVPDWEMANSTNRMESAQCQEFKHFATDNKNFLTEGLIIIKDGQILYEYYDDHYGIDVSHPLWSISKTFTGILLGTAVRDGRINLDMPLSAYYPHGNNTSNYQKILIKNLLYLDAGYNWNETELDVIDNPVVSMLYGAGHEDMTNFVLGKRIIKQGPAYKWNYSTGLPTVTMGVLKKVYATEYEEMPWRNLFNPLGMKNVTFERDITGTYIGGASVFSTPRDLAKLGYLLLNNGQWNGDIILPPEWIKVMLTPSPGYVSSGTIVTDIKDTGVYGGSLWLNRPIKNGLGKPYPNSPEDMFLAIGHLGQFLIMLPTQNMIIVRTGSDQEFHSKTDHFVSGALACFATPNSTVGKVQKTNPLSIGLGNIIRNIRNALQATTLQSAIAKNVCSCHLISGVDISTCLKRNKFSFAKFFSKIVVKKVEEKDGRISVQVWLAKLSRLFRRHSENSAKAYFTPAKPEFGCTLN